MFEISRVDPCPVFFACGNLGLRGKLAQSLASAESRKRRLNEFSENAGGESHDGDINFAPHIWEGGDPPASSPLPNEIFGKVSPTRS